MGKDMERCDIAVERKHELGCNCCQAVLLAFEKEIRDKLSTNLDGSAECSVSSESVRQKLVSLGSGFGAGMGNMDATCGALVGAGMVAGLLGCKTRSLAPEFKERVGALRCEDIKKNKLCSCDNCVRHAVELCENLAE